MSGGGVYAVDTPVTPNGVMFGVERLKVARRFIGGALSPFMCVCETPCHSAARGDDPLTMQA